MKKATLQPESARCSVSKETQNEYIAKLSRMIECKTVWTPENANAEQYSRFYNAIDEMFPNIAKTATKLTFGGGCFVYVINGKKATKNVMLMSHHDVVDGDDTWHTDPFTPTVKEGFLYGRGTIDTKTPLFAELQAVEELLADGYDFNGIDLYIGSSNNEEVCGDGIVLAVDYFKKNNIHFDTVIDEGGAITQGQIPGVALKSAVVAVHEKSRHMYRCTAELDAKGHGGFGGSKDNAVERLSAFINEVSKKKNKICKGKFYPEVRQTFLSHAPYMSFPLNVLFKHLTFFSPLVKKGMMLVPAASTMLSTGVSFTTLDAGSKSDPQIRAKSAETTMFVRCVREETMSGEMKQIEKIAKKYNIKIELIERDYCRPTDFNGNGYKTVEIVLHKCFPDVIVAPFLLTAGTDARRFTDVADNILRFAPIDLSKAQFATIHAADENIGIENVGQCVVFYKEFVKEISKN